MLVELINDSTSEDDETLLLGIFNPVGGSFGGLEKLTAMRTMVGDDFCWGKSLSLVSRWALVFAHL